VNTHFGEQCCPSTALPYCSAAVQQSLDGPPWLPHMPSDSLGTLFVVHVVPLYCVETCRRRPYSPIGTPPLRTRQIKRVRNKYKVKLKSGIMKLNDTEFMFNNMDGEFIW
jgi:hypothetical protein